MASTNPLEQQLLDLFPDNFNQEISAEDMRTYVSSIMSEKEEVILKLQTASDIAVNKIRIWEKSIFIIEDDGVNNGIYLSNVNNPINISQCTKIADLATSTENGNLKSDGTVPMDATYIPLVGQDIATKGWVEDITDGAVFPPNSYQSFLNIYNDYRASNEADYFYDVNENIERIHIVDSIGTIYYVVDLLYTGSGDIDTKKITNNIGTYVTTIYIYTNGVVTSKDITITNI